MCRTYPYNYLLQKRNKYILVAVEAYPDLKGGLAMMYVHARNLYYKEYGLEITVLNFSTEVSYTYEGINVLSIYNFVQSTQKYDILVLHAANIKHHYKFLKQYGNNFSDFVFFYHGHEILKINKVYSKPYDYMKRNFWKILFQNLYDNFKFFLWRCFLPKISYKSTFIFVSYWILNEFLKWTKLDEKMLEGRCFIIYNCVGKKFEIGQYNDSTVKDYDFVTIRGNLDDSKYSIDIVNRLAFNSKECKFLVIGKGSFFKFNEKAPNLEWRNQMMSHDEIIQILQKARYALMPTRTDAQGLMMCEMAAFGIPVITSDIPVCHEVFDEFSNVYFIDNEDENISLNRFSNISSVCKKDTRFYIDNTVEKEIQIMCDL